MKLLSKLGALGSCWQSPPPATVSEFEQENAAAPPPKRRRPAAGSSAHWRPALTAISEDSCAASCGEDERKTKLLEKGIRRPKAISVRVKPSNSDNSPWRFQAQIAIPAFSPTPFLF
uniref:Uncharacterized protein n=1 Tax=Kalanchoe fedtschenkoi TaxID=63787 RepID=A0A7N0RIM3_KALFE